jgi:Tfp pilus assembly protein PilV
MGSLRLHGLRRRADRISRRLAEDRGVTLVETLISAAILVMIVASLFTTLDASGRTTANNRGRTVAASLAEQDQERLRALSAPSLSNYHEVTTKVVDGNTYTINSDTDWVYDATGSTESCLNSSSTQANYIRITSTVTSPVVGKRVKPVTVRSLVAPRVGDFGANQGTLAVYVKDERDKPVQGITVSTVGPESLSDTTNEFGCAIFSHITAGEYKAVLDQPGWVDTNRNQHLEQGVTVPTGKTSAIQLTYAMAAGVEVRFDTKVGTNAPQAARGNAITVANPLMPPRPPDPAGVARFLSPTAPVSSPMIPSSGLFPFPSGYTAYAGDCDANNPTLYDPDYYDTNSGFGNVLPGQTSQVTVREPALNIHVRNRKADGTYVDYPGAYVLIKLTNAGCTAATSTFQFTTNAQGRLDEPGLPFGTYQVCVDDRNDPSILPGARRRVTVTGIVNTNPAGLAVNASGVPTRKIDLSYWPSGLSGLGMCS